MPAVTYFINVDLQVNIKSAGDTTDPCSSPRPDWNAFDVAPAPTLTQNSADSQTECKIWTIVVGRPQDSSAGNNKSLGTRS